MRSKKITILVLISLLVIGLSACNVGDRSLTRDYDTDGLDRFTGRNVTPDNFDNYRTYGDDNRNGLMNNRNGIMNNRNGTMNNRNGIMNNRNNRNGLNRYGDNRYLNDNYPYAGQNRNRLTNVNADADRMANVAARVRGVDDATVVIAGNNAYVGLDLSDRIQTRDSDRVEKSVYRALSKFATRYNVSITSDADFFGRLRDMGDGMKRGTPLDRYQTDFRDFDDRFTNFRR